ncbi:MAG: sulfatase [Phycisphaerae bacterium]|nr:sulfatase [Phycisphaerae bacterium]
MNETVSRRNFLKIIGYATPAVIFGGCEIGRQISNDQVRPNVILFIGDDISVDDFGCYGHPTIRTPNVDRMADKGAIFSNAFLTASSCSPSRCSIITGRFPHNTEASELHMELPKNQVTFPMLLKKSGYYTAQAGKWHLGGNKNVVDAFDIRVSSAPSGAEKWVEVLQKRDRSKPFFLWFAAHDAHRGWDTEEFIGKPYEPDEAQVPPYLVDDEPTRKDLAKYYNEVTRFDDYIGRVMKELERQGVADNTILLVIADNGRSFPRCKTRVYDSGMQTPLVAYWPNGIKCKGEKRVGLVSTIDIAPTILELAGVDVPKSVQGVSFANMLKDPKVKTRRYVFSEHNWHDYEAYEREVRTERFMYVRNERAQYANQGPADSVRSASHKSLLKARADKTLTEAQKDVFQAPRSKEELFDVVKDPLQLNNLASDPAYQKELQKLRKVIDRWQKETHDTVPADLTHDIFDRQTGLLLKGENSPTVKRRKTTPGSERNASTVTSKGPI